MWRSRELTREQVTIVTRRRISLINFNGPKLNQIVFTSLFLLFKSGTTLCGYLSDYIRGSFN